MQTHEEKPLSPWWRRGALILMAAGFTVLAAITVMTCRIVGDLVFLLAGAVLIALGTLLAVLKNGKETT